MRDKINRKLTAREKQYTPLPGEVTPENAFTKISIYAKRAANRFDLKNFKINSSEGKK